MLCIKLASLFGIIRCFDSTHSETPFLCSGYTRKPHRMKIVLSFKQNH